MKGTAYICGPMRGYPQFNFPAFDAAEIKLRDMGYRVFSPATMDREIGFDPNTDTLDDFNLEDCVRRDIEAIIKSDFIALLPGWEDSVGAKAEIHVARWLRKPVKAYETL